MDQAIDKQKTALSTTIFFTFEKSIWRTSTNETNDIDL